MQTLFRSSALSHALECLYVSKPSLLSHVLTSSQSSDLVLCVRWRGYCRPAIGKPTPLPHSRGGRIVQTCTYDDKEGDGRFVSATVRLDSTANWVAEAAAQTAYKRVLRTVRERPLSLLLLLSSLPAKSAKCALNSLQRRLAERPGVVLAGCMTQPWRTEDGSLEPQAPGGGSSNAAAPACRGSMHHLTLAAASLPHTTVHGFATNDDAIPLLPNVEKLLGSQPPQFLLLVHPADQRQEDDQLLGTDLLGRLEAAFPGSALAGMVAESQLDSGTPADATSAQMGWGLCWLSLGNQTMYRGAVGLTLVPRDRGARLDDSTVLALVRTLLGCDQFAHSSRLITAPSLRRALSPAFVSFGKQPPMETSPKWEPTMLTTGFQTYAFGKLSMQRRKELPLVTLASRVLWPGERMVLDALDSRTLLLVRRALESGTVLGAVHAGAGCTAVIQYAGTAADGSAVVEVVGGRRFSVRPGTVRVLPATFGQRVGQVDWIEDDPVSEADGGVQELLDLARHASRMLARDLHQIMSMEFQPIIEFPDMGMVLSELRQKDPSPQTTTGHPLLSPQRAEPTQDTRVEAAAALSMWLPLLFGSLDREEGDCGKALTRQRWLLSRSPLERLREQVSLLTSRGLIRQHAVEVLTELGADNLLIQLLGTQLQGDDYLYDEDCIEDADDDDFDDADMPESEDGTDDEDEDDDSDGEGPGAGREGA